LKQTLVILSQRHNSSQDLLSIQNEIPSARVGYYNKVAGGGFDAHRSREALRKNPLVHFDQQGQITA